jgi:endonuclease/exonuclease/phosphatase family metal-dependent hydrolase
VASLNVLHGLFCPRDSASCRLSDRIELLFAWLVAHGCPDVVTLQEVSDAVAPLVMARLAAPCPYTAVAHVRLHGLDDEMLLSRHPLGTTELIRLHGGFRTALFVRVDHPLGPVDVFSTHLASGSDGATDPCGASCPAECQGAGAATLRDCQAVQVANAVAGRHDVPLPAIVTGDFNESPGSFVYRQLTERGWIDSYLAAGNPECNPATGDGCTSGRQDEDLSQLQSPASNENERIDFAFVVPPAPGSPCKATLDTAADIDGDGTATRIFANQPNPFAPCGPAPAAVCWPSDHEGTELDLACD